MWDVICQGYFLKLPNEADKPVGNFPGGFGREKKRTAIEFQRAEKANEFKGTAFL